MPIQASTLNHRLSSPNKLFESLATGLPVVVSDFIEMRRIVLEDPDGPLGAVCDPADPASVSRAIRSILELDEEARDALRARCLRAAHERWNWETESRLSPSTTRWRWRRVRGQAMPRRRVPHERRRRLVGAGSRRPGAPPAGRPPAAATSTTARVSYTSVPRIAAATFSQSSLA
jgi:hypothetical protein